MAKEFTLTSFLLCHSFTISVSEMEVIMSVKGIEVKDPGSAITHFIGMMMAVFAFM